MTGNATTQREVRLAGGTVGTELAGIGSVIRLRLYQSPPLASRRCQTLPTNRGQAVFEAQGGTLRAGCAMPFDGRVSHAKCKNLTHALSNLLKPLSPSTEPRLVSLPISARVTSCNLCHMKFANRVWIGRHRVTAGAESCIGDPEVARGPIRTRKLAAALAPTEVMGAAPNTNVPSTTQQTGVEL